jgi:hypothetical protein
MAFQRNIGFGNLLQKSGIPADNYYFAAVDALGSISSCSSIFAWSVRSQRANSPIGDGRVASLSSPLRDCNGVPNVKASVELISCKQIGTLLY